MISINQEDETLPYIKWSYIYIFFTFRKLIYKISRWEGIRVIVHPGRKKWPFQVEDYFNTAKISRVKKKNSNSIGTVGTGANWIDILNLKNCLTCWKYDFVHCGCSDDLVETTTACPYLGRLLGISTLQRVLYEYRSRSSRRNLCYAGLSRSTKTSWC